MKNLLIGTVIVRNWVILALVILLLGWLFGGWQVKAQPPRRACRAYHHVQRRHARERRHHHLNPFTLPWN